MIFRHLDILLLNMLHADFLQMRTKKDILVGVRGSVRSMMSGVSPGEFNILPHLRAEFLHRGVEHEEPAIQFEERHDSIRSSDRQTQRPREPVHVRLIGGIRLNTQQRRNRETPHRHRHSETVEQDRIHARTATILRHQKPVAIFDDIDLLLCKIRQRIKQTVAVILEVHPD